MPGDHLCPDCRHAPSFGEQRKGGVRTPLIFVGGKWPRSQSEENGAGGHQPERVEVGRRQVPGQGAVA